MDRKYCPFCMYPIDGEDHCPRCGKSVDSYVPTTNQLPNGTLLDGRYLVGGVLGAGGFGITYIGLDLKLDLRLAIKEYYPTDRSSRNTAFSLDVVPQSGKLMEQYEYGKKKFLKEAQTMAKFDSQHVIVSVKDFFEANNTAYIVMEYVEGVTFKDIVEKLGTFKAGELLALMQPLFVALDDMHKLGIIHRDISPENIMLETGGIRLLDFGCARDTAGVASDGTLTVAIKEGYAPPEQYTHEDQGPWTDVYAFAATLYFCLTGQRPQTSPSRLLNDNLVSPRKLNDSLTKQQENALLYAMMLKPRERCQSVKVFHNRLYKDFRAGTEPDLKALMEKAKQVVNPGEEKLSELPDTRPKTDSEQLSKEHDVSEKKHDALNDGLAHGSLNKDINISDEVNEENHTKIKSRKQNKKGSKKQIYSVNAEITEQENGDVSEEVLTENIAIESNSQKLSSDVPTKKHFIGKAATAIVVVAAVLAIAVTGLTVLAKREKSIPVIEGDDGSVSTEEQPETVDSYEQYVWSDPAEGMTEIFSYVMKMTRQDNLVWENSSFSSQNDTNDIFAKFWDAIQQEGAIVKVKMNRSAENLHLGCKSILKPYTLIEPRIIKSTSRYVEYLGSDIVEIPESAGWSAWSVRILGEYPESYTAVEATVSVLVNEDVAKAYNTETWLEEPLLIQAYVQNKINWDWKLLINGNISQNGHEEIEMQYNFSPVDLSDPSITDNFTVFPIFGISIGPKYLDEPYFSYENRSEGTQSINSFHWTLKYSGIVISAAGYNDVILPAQVIDEIFTPEIASWGYDKCTYFIDLWEPVSEQLGLSAEEILTSYIGNINKIKIAVESVSEDFLQNGSNEPQNDEPEDDGEPAPVTDAETDSSQPTDTKYSDKTWFYPPKLSSPILDNHSVLFDFGGIYTEEDVLAYVSENPGFIPVFSPLYSNNATTAEVAAAFMTSGAKLVINHDEDYNARLYFTDLSMDQLYYIEPTSSEKAQSRQGNITIFDCTELIKVLSSNGISLFDISGFAIGEKNHEIFEVYGIQILVEDDK